MSFEAKLFYLAVGFCIGALLWRRQHEPRNRKREPVVSMLGRAG
jgi:hypothetical protein